MWCTLRLNYKDKERTSSVEYYSAVEVVGFTYSLRNVVKKIQSDEVESFHLSIEAKTDQDDFSMIYINSEAEIQFMKSLPLYFTDLQLLQTYINSIEPFKNVKMETKEKVELNQDLDMEKLQEQLRNKVHEQSNLRNKELEQLKMALIASEGDNERELYRRLKSVCYSVHPGNEKRAITTLNVMEILNIAISAMGFSDNILNEGAEFNIILIPGRSAFLHGILLPTLGIKAFSFAYSGAPYIKDKVNIQQILKYRDYLSKLGLTPSILDNAKYLNFLDYIETGVELDCLLIFFAHWKHDTVQKTVTEPEQWLKQYKDNQHYQLYKRKTRFHATITIDDPTDIDPGLSAIPLNVVPFLGVRLASALCANLFHCHLPMYPAIFWDLPDEVSEMLFNSMAEEARWHSGIALKMLALIQKVISVANLMYGMSKNDKQFFWNLIENNFISASEAITFEIFCTEYISLFVAKLAVIYTKMVASTEQIGPGKKYETVIKFLLDFNHNDPTTKKMIFELHKNCEAISIHLRNHPEIDKLNQALVELYDSLKIYVKHEPLAKQDSKEVASIAIVNAFVQSIGNKTAAKKLPPFGVRAKQATSGCIS